MATHEADYQVALANYEAAVAASFAVAAGTPAAQFQATNADAQADWIVAMKPAYVTHAGGIEQANADRTNGLAVAWGTRQTARASAEATKAINESTRGATRAVYETGVQQTFASAMLLAESVRQTAGVLATHTFEIDVATANKEYAIDWAEADKQFHIERLQDNDDADDNRKEARADAQLVMATSLADARKTWKQTEIAARKIYTNNTVPAAKTRTVSLAASSRSTAIDLAGYQAALDQAYGSAEATYWYAETAAENIYRSDKALADADFWTARESAKVTATGNVHSAAGLPWTEYLADRAMSEQGSWAAIRPSYLASVTGHNTADDTYQSTVATAHVARIDALAAADLARTTTMAWTGETREVAAAAALEAYFAALVTPAETFVAGEAAAQRTHEVALATALRNYTLDNDSTAYHDAIDAADETRKNAIKSLENAYEAAEAGAVANLLNAEAGAENTRALAATTASHSRALARADANRDYHVAEAVAHKVLVHDKAAADKTYWMAEASEFASAASTLAGSSSTPWADHDLAKADAYQTWAGAVAPARETQRRDIATPEATAETAVADAGYASAAADAAADAGYANAVSAAQLNAAGAQASMINTIGSAGGQKAAYPETSAPDDLAGLYTVPAASSNDHLASVTLTTWSSGWQWGWGGWGWGGLWAGVNGWGGLWGAGWGGGWGMGWGMGLGMGWGGGWNPWWGGGWWNAWNSGYFGLSAPAELRLPAGFWDIAGETEDVLSEDTVPDVRYAGPGSGYELVPLQPESGPPGGGSPVIAASPGGTRYDEQHVQAILEARAPQVAGYWASRGQITPPGFASRDNQPDDSSPGVAREIQSKADVRPEPGKSEQSVSVSAIGVFTPMQVASSIVTKVLIVGAAAFTQLGSKGDPELTDFERAGFYLDGLLAPDNGEFKKMFGELHADATKIFTLHLTDVDDYALGFAKGFFADGFWGNLTALWQAVKFATWMGYKHSNAHALIPWYAAANKNFYEEEIRIATQVVFVADIVHKVMQELATEVTLEAASQYQVIKNGSPEQLRALGDKHKQFAAVILGLNVKLAGYLADMTPEERGRLYGLITWEIVQTVAEVVFTGGAAKAVTGTAKFVHIADKLADFGKYGKQLGGKLAEAAKEVGRLFKEGGELRRLLKKLDDVPDDGSLFAHSAKRVARKFGSAIDLDGPMQEQAKGIVAKAGSILRMKTSGVRVGFWDAAKGVSFYDKLDDGQLALVLSKQLLDEKDEATHLLEAIHELLHKKDIDRFSYEKMVKARGNKEYERMTERKAFSILKKYLGGTVPEGTEKYHELFLRKLADEQ